MQYTSCKNTVKCGMVAAREKDYVMAGTLKKIGIGTLMAGALSLLPLKDTFAQTNAPGDDVKSGWTIRGETFIGPGESALAYSETGEGIGMIIYRGKNDFDKTESEMIAQVESYFQSQGVNGKLFIETIPQNSFSEYMVYVNGQSPTPDAVYSDEFSELLPEIIEQQKRLDTERITVANTLSRNP